jgi:hypothetical protein
MPVVRKPSSGRFVKRGPVQETVKVTTTRSSNSIEELGDTNFGTLDDSKDGMIVSYDSKTDKFILITADNVLEESVVDEDLPDVFIDQIEAEVDLGTIALDDLDGGTW